LAFFFPIVFLAGLFLATLAGDLYFFSAAFAFADFLVIFFATLLAVS
jgi:hypothetical protein